MFFWLFAWEISTHSWGPVQIHHPSEIFSFLSCSSFDYSHTNLTLKTTPKCYPTVGSVRSLGIVGPAQWVPWFLVVVGLRSPLPCWLLARARLSPRGCPFLLRPSLKFSQSRVNPVLTLQIPLAFNFCHIFLTFSSASSWRKFSAFKVSCD